MEGDYTQATAPGRTGVEEGAIQVESAARDRADKDRQDVEHQFELAAMREADRVEKLRRQDPVALEERYKDNDRKSQTKMDAFTKK